MGYTHYWYQNEIPEEDFDNLRSAVPLIFELTDAKLGDAFGKPGTKPHIDKGKIVFNGIEPDDYETFYLERAPSSAKTECEDNFGWFSFCKTQYRPYDIVVVATLCLLDLYCRDYVLIQSDGRAKEWQDGLELARSVRAAASIPKGVRHRG